jgi:hypothetical protein
MTKIHALREFLAGHGVQAAVERLLFECWGELRITSRSENMESSKLLGRTESLEWRPPFLEFDIERHGATVNNSIYAHVHHWTVNVETGEAFMEVAGKRQVGTRAGRLDVKPLARDIASKILCKGEDKRLVWASATKVRLRIGEIVHATNQQTTAGRRRRFKTALENELAPRGWKRTSVGRVFLTFEAGDQ